MFVVISQLFVVISQLFVAISLIVCRHSIFLLYKFPPSFQYVLSKKYFSMHIQKAKKILLKSIQKVHYWKSGVDGDDCSNTKKFERHIKTFIWFINWCCFIDEGHKWREKSRPLDCEFSHHLYTNFINIYMLNLKKWI